MNDDLNYTLTLQYGWLINVTTLTLIVIAILAFTLIIALPKSNTNPNDRRKTTIFSYIVITVIVVTVILTFLSISQFHNGQVIDTTGAESTHQSEIIDVSTVDNPYIHIGQDTIKKFVLADGQTVFATNRQFDHAMRGDILRYSEYAVYDTRPLGPANYVKDIFVAVSITETP